MSIFQKLFGKKKPHEVPFIPTPTQYIPGLDPIIVQAVENLFPDKSVQEAFFEGLQKYVQNANTLIILALLSMTKADDVVASKKYVLGTLSTHVLGTNTHYFIMRDCDFHDLKGAEKWVRSITKVQT